VRGEARVQLGAQRAKDSHPLDALANPDRDVFGPSILPV